jgi:hypothetical protein
MRPARRLILESPRWAPWTRPPASRVGERAAGCRRLSRTVHGRGRMPHGRLCIRGRDPPGEIARVDAATIVGKAGRHLDHWKIDSVSDGLRIVSYKLVLVQPYRTEVPAVPTIAPARTLMAPGPMAVQGRCRLRCPAVAAPRRRRHSRIPDIASLNCALSRNQAAPRARAARRLPSWPYRPGTRAGGAGQPRGWRLDTESRGGSAHRQPPRATTAPPTRSR